ncbi:unnamed protein product [Wickerhamomyces anomalus]
MLVKRVLVNNLLKSARCCYSTISAQPTVTRASPVIPSIITPKSSPSTTIKTKPSTPTSIKQQIVNLQKVPTHFLNEYGVYEKIDLLIQKLRYPNTPIRIGLLGSEKTFLNTILADPFASDQSWYESLLKRSNGGSLFKYGENPEILSNNYTIPSPFLQTHNIEFLEIHNIEYNDGCHLYINFGSPIDIKWPTFEFKDVDSELILEANEINSKKSFEAINLLRESPLNSTIYTNLYNSSHFPKFNQTLLEIIEPSVIITKNFNSIIKILDHQSISNSLTKTDLELKTQKIQSLIKQWDEYTHYEFQKTFIPFINSFESKQLSWWKLYYKNDDVENLLIRMLDESGFFQNSLQKISYIKGQIDSFNANDLKNSELIEVSNRLNSNSLTKLHNDLISNELLPIQNYAIKLLLINFIGLQLPVVVISSLGWYLYDFSLYSMFGLGSLGLILGFNNISKKWVNKIESFKQTLFEKMRISIMETNQQLYSTWDAKYELENIKIKEKLQLIESLKK